MSGNGGADRDRTGDPLLAKQVLSQLSYSPVHVDTSEAHGDGANVVGLGRVELPTSALSGLRSNQLSYRPMNEPPSSAGRGLRHCWHRARYRSSNLCWALAVSASAIS